MIKTNSPTKMFTRKSSFYQKKTKKKKTEKKLENKAPFGLNVVPTTVYKINVPRIIDLKYQAIRYNHK